MKTIKQGTYLCLMETPRHRSNGCSCLAWYTRTNEEAAGGLNFALQCTIKRMTEYNRQMQLFGRVILVYVAPKNQSSKPIACYNTAGDKIW